MRVILTGLICLFVCIACTDYTPKPRGYFRVDPPVAIYTMLPLDNLPYSFHISMLSEIELPPLGEPQEWINISYLALNAKIYCSYLPVTACSLEKLMEDSRLLVSRQAVNARVINEQEYSNPDEKVYGSLFELDGESPSPLQFVLTDSVSHFFRGSLLYNCVINADSLAPVTEYLRKDIIELIQTFTWNNN